MQPYLRISLAPTLHWTAEVTALSFCTLHAAHDLIDSLGKWDEYLAWITLWGVWPSGEDWPEFYAWRGALGERRSLDIAPGHRFDYREALCWPSC
jgi:hypothetical protein